MKIPLDDTELWYEEYAALNDDEQIGFLMETLKKPLSNDFFEGIDFIDIIIEIIGYLKKEKQYEKIFELDKAIAEPNYEVLKDKLYYLEDPLVDYCLFLHQKEQLKSHLKSYRVNPIESIEYLTTLLDKLNFYGESDLALDISEYVYEIVKDDNELMGGSEEDFANTILMLELQSLYHKIKNGQTVGRKKLIVRLNRYGYKLNDEFDHIVNALSSDGWNGSKYGENEYKQDKKRFNNGLMLLFCKYMLEAKKLNFVVSSEIWYVAMNSFQKDNPESSFEHPFDKYFLLDGEGYNRNLVSRFGFLSNKKANGVAVAYGMHYVYDFLFAAGVISAVIYTESLDIVKEKRIMVLTALGPDAWEYGFVCGWERPSSISPEEYQLESELIQRSFREKINIQDQLPRQYIKWVEEQVHKRKVAKHLNSGVKRPEAKVGRNDPCPCGSGKKYKKCCMNS